MDTAMTTITTTIEGAVDIIIGIFGDVYTWLIANPLGLLMIGLSIGTGLIAFGINKVKGR